MFTGDTHDTGLGSIFKNCCRDKIGGGQDHFTTCVSPLSFSTMLKQWCNEKIENSKEKALTMTVQRRRLGLGRRDSTNFNGAGAPG